ncbi:MAG: XRE family transcriptional regulator [Rhodocyclaceae bacterium]|nr:MAG: XRE family transcriptional regulator [Rhodocyclaceae bacterium]
MEKQTDVGLVFGEVLRKHRKAAGLSQEELALDSSLDRTYISMLERGQRQPSLQTVLAIAKRLKVPAGELVSQVESLINKR